MYEKVEWLHGALCFTPLLGLIDLALILHFLICWVVSARRTGWKLDFWYATLFLGLFQYLLVMYPFNGSVFNRLTTQYQDTLAPYVDLAFIVGVVGYLFVWIGRGCCTWVYARHANLSVLRPLTRIVELNIKSRTAFLALSCLVLVLGIPLLAFQFSQQNYFHGRALFLAQDTLRPLFNLMLSLILIFYLFFSLRFVQIKRKSELILFVFIMALTLFSGVRGLILTGVLQLVLFSLFYREGRGSLIKLALFGGLLFGVAVVVGNVREGIFDTQLIAGKFFQDYFYGNNFSDTRDFACLLSYWDQEFLYGKTYVAALFSFIPRECFPLREEWGMALMSNRWVGYDSSVMPGLRPGLFGEAFFNFGFFGVAFFGWWFGFALRYADLKIKESVARSKDLISGYSHTFLFSCVHALMIGGIWIWTLYIFIILNVLLIPFRFLQKGSLHRLAGQRVPDPRVVRPSRSKAQGLEPLG